MFFNVFNIRAKPPWLLTASQACGTRTPVYSALQLTSQVTPKGTLRLTPPTTATTTPAPPARHWAALGIWPSNTAHNILLTLKVIPPTAHSPGYSRLPEAAPVPHACTLEPQSDIQTGRRRYARSSPPTPPRGSQDGRQATDSPTETRLRVQRGTTGPGVKNGHLPPTTLQHWCQRQSTVRRQSSKSH